MNGLNMIGFGAESIGMGGADLAVARDTSAWNTNPAGIAQIPKRRLDLFGAGATPITMAHRDRFGNDAEVSNRNAFLAGGGYAGRLSGGPVSMGIGVFGQGGTGSVYKDLATPFGNRDELSTLFRIAKVTPGVACRIGDALFLGTSLQVVYADIRQKVFPGTSFVDPSDSSNAFFGFESKGMKGVSAGVKLGVMYRIGGRATIGAAYTSRIPIRLKDGELTANLSATGLGKVRYRDARIEGLSLPREAGLGISFRPVRTLLLATEVNWLDWSGSIRRSTLRASDPDNPAAPPNLEAPSTHNWRDQYVLALGLAWEATNRLILRAGYNYGRNPIPAETMSPLMAAHAKHHMTAGGGYAFGPSWRTDLAIEYTLNNKVTYHNPELPFGPGAQSEGEAIAAHVMISRAW